MPLTPEERLVENNKHVARLITDKTMSLGTQEAVIAVALALQFERILIALDDISYQLQKSRGRMP